MAVAARARGAARASFHLNPTLLHRLLGPAACQMVLLHLQIDQTQSPVQGLPPCLPGFIAHPRGDGPSTACCTPASGLACWLCMTCP